MPNPKNADGKLAKIILKACSYRPKDRYKNPTEMRMELEKIAEIASDANTVPQEKETNKSQMPEKSATVIEAPNVSEKTVSEVSANRAQVRHRKKRWVSCVFWITLVQMICYTVYPYVCPDAARNYNANYWWFIEAAKGVGVIPRHLSRFGFDSEFMKSFILPFIGEALSVTSLAGMIGFFCGLTLLLIIPRSKGGMRYTKTIVVLGILTSVLTITDTMYLLYVFHRGHHNIKPYSGIFIVLAAILLRTVVLCIAKIRKKKIN